jgi:hypothetical protein
MFLTTTLPRRSESKYHPVQIYNGHKFVDRRNDKPSGIDLYAWQLKANSQPLFKQLQTARKVLTTHDWMVKYNNKAMERAFFCLCEKNIYSLLEMN